MCINNNKRMLVTIQFTKKGFDIEIDLFWLTYINVLFQAGRNYHI
jgi:hypothetical protein